MDIAKFIFGSWGIPLYRKSVNLFALEKTLPTPCIFCNENLTPDISGVYSRIQDVTKLSDVLKLQETYKYVIIS